MLEMKTACETCQAPLAAEGVAYICSYECTFCKTCTERVHQGRCPNCGGALMTRPTRIKKG